MISVERVLQYSKLPSEAPLKSDKKHQPPSDWPQNGQIKGENVCLKYSESGPMVLKHLKFSIESKEKVSMFWYEMNECLNNELTFIINGQISISFVPHQITYVIFVC